MTVKQFRKKSHEPTLDDDYCPRRKIKKLDTSSQYIEKALSNVVIVSKIMGHVIGNDPAVNHLDLRRVNSVFQSAVIHSIRKQYRHVQVSSIDEEDDPDMTDNDDIKVNLNETVISINRIPKFFNILRSVAKVRIESIEFMGFEVENKIIHDVILRELFLFDNIYIRSFKGADEICEMGCEMCYHLLCNAHAYGPMQWAALQYGFPKIRHFKYLIITEILLAEIATNSLMEVGSMKEALEKMKNLVGYNIQVDTLEIVVSDRGMSNPKSTNHPRNVIDCIIKQWKPETVKIKFMTAYSSGDYTLWSTKHVFDEVSFDAKYVKETYLSHSQRLSMLEIDMLDGDAIAQGLLKSSSDKNMIPNKDSMEYVVANVKKVFPSNLVFVTLPLALHDLAREQFDKFCKIMIAFLWKDERIVRNSQFYVRTYCFGLTHELIEKKVKSFYTFNGRLVNRTIVKQSESRLKIFGTWKPDHKMVNFAPCTHVSFEDDANRCKVHLEVCVEL